MTTDPKNIVTAPQARIKLVDQNGLVTKFWFAFFRDIYTLIKNPAVIKGSGSPEGVVTANIGALYSRTDGGSGTTLYVKESGTGDTGWVAK